MSSLVGDPPEFAGALADHFEEGGELESFGHQCPAYRLEVLLRADGALQVVRTSLEGEMAGQVMSAEVRSGEVTLGNVGT